MSFGNLAEAKRIVGYYAIANGKGLKVKKSDTGRVRYICAVGCPFELLISQDNRDQGFKIKTLKTKHTCEPAYKNPRATPQALAHYFKNKVQNNPKYKRNWRLEAYAQELRDSNPGSDVVINISKDALAEGKRRFLRMYIFFQALKIGWKAGLRPLIGLDGTFLKGKCKGILLVAMAQDSVKHFYPLAWVVVDKETGRTWKWFMELLRNSLELEDGEKVTFMSDMQKGLLEVVSTVLPKANHRWCARHIEANWSKNWRGIEMKKLMWWCAWSTYEEEFKDQLKTLGDIHEDAARELLHYPPQNWCRAYFDTTCKNQMVDNNFTESFNK
ncbi:PREDICTED: uncharacterized protein LOC109225975 [Nicotiana attenuata]|uniref:uncharacterized protein LOC109225975 n=1 Tax=Nicotiana attenuata TaxID=49451 RepID=UPI0009053030|nr:PREDICTED: uncharacterized protein LOC109225975 [Nicotiana attenuata]